MSRPIGIFDSGLGGLTVVRAIRRRLPAESIVYFGDTARVPYGIKSGQTINRFAEEDGAFLLRFDPKFIVVACNTASATAIPTLSSRFRQSIAGVIEPGARVAARSARGRPIGVIGTEATINSGAYRRAILRHLPGAWIVEKACPLLVPLVEEGRMAGDPVVRAVLAEYLKPLCDAGVGSIVLGCTHYPLLRDDIAETIGPDVALTDSAEAVAEDVAARLESEGLREADSPEVVRGGSPHPPPSRGSLRFYVSDNPERFRRIGCRFLGEEIGEVGLVTPEDFFAGPPADVSTGALHGEDAL
jgi:glutamate racemase